MTQTVLHPHLSHRRAVSSSSAHASRPSTTRASRPPSHRKGASLVNLSIAKLGAGSARTSSRERQPEMAASFLNFCATCENQITVPDNYLLYCSESCRRKDSRKPLSASLPTTASMSTTPPGSPPMSPRIIVPPMTPTKLARPTTGPRIPSDCHDVETDLDPTEWKPVIAQRPSSSSVLSAAPAPTSASSEAWQYLARSQGRDEPPVAWTPGHRSLASVSTLGASPSLTDTVSVASSYSSNHSGASDYMSAVHRPLPPRHNPSLSGGGSATKGVELVMPHVDPAVVGVATTLTDSNGGKGGLWEKTQIPIITIAPVCCEMSHSQ